MPWGVDVQDTFFDSGRKCVAMVTAYYGKNGGKILRRELLPQFFTNSHEIWHRCLPWGVDVQDTFFDSGRKCVAMVTAYYGKNGGGGKILRRELLPQFFTNSHEIWHRCLPWGVDVQDSFFDSGRKCVAMVTAYYGKNWGKILHRELLPQFFTNSHEIWHRCLPLGVDVQDTFFDSGRKCVAMVTAYYTVKKYCGAGVLITFSDISSLQLQRTLVDLYNSQHISYVQTVPNHRRAFTRLLILMIRFSSEASQSMISRKCRDDPSHRERTGGSRRGHANHRAR